MDNLANQENWKKSVLQIELACKLLINKEKVKFFRHKIQLAS